MFGRVNMPFQFIHDSSSLLELRLSFKSPLKDFVQTLNDCDYIITARQVRKEREKGFHVRILDKIREYSNYKGTLRLKGVRLGG